MTTLSEIQRRTPGPDAPLRPPGRRLDGPELEHYLDRHGSAYVVLRDPDGRPHAHRAFYIRNDAVFWLPPHFAAAHIDAQSWAAIAFIDESRDGFAFVTIQGEAHVVEEGEWQGWLRVDAAEVTSHVTDGFAA